jgi:beta-lactamase class A
MTLDAVRLAELAAASGLAEPSIVVAGVSAGLPSANLDAMRPTYPASMIKVPIAFALEEARIAGRLRLSDRVSVDVANMTTNDAPSPFVSGTMATLAELGHAMLAASDNVATNVLIDVLGRTQIGETCARLGLRETHVRRKLSGSLPLIADPEATGRNAHPAADAAALFLHLARRNESAWIVDALGAQMWNDKLAAGLAPGDRFAHKTGDTDEVSHDGGILELATGGVYVIVVYTALPATPENDAKIAAFMRELRPDLLPRK